MTLLREILLATILHLSIAFQVQAAPPAADGFRRLNGDEIRKTFVGRVFSDDVPFADRYLADGQIQSESMGTKKTYAWRIEQDRLCIADPQDDICYFVWKKNNEIRLLPDGLGLPGDGFIR